MQEELPIRELLHLCLSNERDEDWRLFVRATQPAIANTIINTIRRWREPSPSLVDDLIQETFLKVFANDRKALRNLRNEHENTIFGYLKVTASNVTRDHFRQLQNRINEVEPSDPVLPPAPDGLDRLAFKHLKDKIHILLSKSGSETRERDESIFWLYYEQGYTAKEIAAIPAIGLTVKGVESTLLRLVRMLRDEGGLASPAGGDP